MYVRTYKTTSGSENVKRGFTRYHTYKIHRPYIRNTKKSNYSSNMGFIEDDVKKQEVEKEAAELPGE
jgi:hypothetical protein